VDTGPVNSEATLYPRKHREVTLVAGRVKFDIFDFPLVGSPDAGNVLAALIDFTCEECHLLHRLLYKAVAQYPQQLAVSILPTPLHEGCNPTVKCHRQEQAYACSFARLAWLLWMTSPDAYARWDEFLVETVDNQPYGLALLRAKELAPIGDFRTGEPHPAADLRIAECVSIFQASTSPKVPVVLLDSGILNGHIPDVDTLLRLLTPHLSSTNTAV